VSYGLRMNFWSLLPRGFTVLAPMEDVTDHVYRRLVCDQGEPDVLMTEFTSAEILCSSKPERALQRLVVGKGELTRRPLVAQIWGSDPMALEKAARLCAERGFAGIDINMGCPVKKISRKGACSALIRFPALAAELIEATKIGAGNLPVSVKTRIGWSKPETDQWCGHLLEQRLAALTVHGRTVKQKSEGMADWHEIARVVALRDTKAPATKIIGNGDLTRANSAEKLASGVDGLMFGRGVFADLGVFRREGYRPYSSWTEGEKIALMERHLTDHFRAWASTKDYHQLKKFFKNYTVNFEGCLALREMLMQTNTTFEALEVLHTWRTRLR